MQLIYCTELFDVVISFYSVQPLIQLRCCSPIYAQSHTIYSWNYLSSRLSLVLLLFPLLNHTLFVKHRTRNRLCTEWRLFNLISMFWCFASAAFFPPSCYGHAIFSLLRYLIAARRPCRTNAFSNHKRWNVLRSLFKNRCLCLGSLVPQSFFRHIILYLCSTQDIHTHIHTHVHHMACTISLMVLH